MAGKNIDDVFAAIIKDCQTIAVEAVKNAAKKTQIDIINEADNCLQKYYTNYKPKRYKRTKYLKNAITPIFEDHSNAKNIHFEIGVEYDSSKLKDHYKSNSLYHQTGTTWFSRSDGGFNYDKNNNGIPEPSWILDNYLEGIHPWAQVDPSSTNTLMEDFFDTQLPNRINQYVQNELFDAITSRL